MKKKPFDPNHDPYYVLDIETTTDWKNIRLVGIYSSVEDTCHIFKHQLEFTDFCRMHFVPDTPVISWNGVRFDYDILKWLWDEDLYETTKPIDGMLLAKIAYPNEYSYSLDAFAKKFELPIHKEVPADKDWYNTVPLEELATYLVTDLSLTRQVVEAMYKDNRWIGKFPKAYSRALTLETQVARLCQEQVNKGVRFDNRQAAHLSHELKVRMQMIEEDLEKDLPSWPLPESKLHYPPKVQFKVDGSHSALLEKYCAKYGAELHPKSAWLDGKNYPLPLTEPFVNTRQISLSNQTDLKSWLRFKGWEPTEWNTKKDKATGKIVRTSPRLTSKDTKEPCPNLKKIGFLAADDISHWLMLRSRKNVIGSDKGTGWLHDAKWESGPAPLSCYILASDADTLGANTARWTHRGIANIPRVSSPYGKQMRQLFCARAGKVWVGWDASSLEACMEAHYTQPYDKEYSDELMDGDVHIKNLEAISPLIDRDHAKTFKYGITYGAQAKKVAGILGVDLKAGEYWFDKFWENNTALRDLKLELDIQASAHGGFIQGLDGRMIGTRSKHSRLNALFQSAGAIVMKYAMIIADMRIKEQYPELAYGLIRYHDEEIWECEDAIIAEKVGEIGVASIRAAGRYLKLNVPLDAEYKIGSNWANVH